MFSEFRLRAVLYSRVGGSHYLFKGKIPHSLNRACTDCFMRLAHVIGGMDMSKPKMTGSAALHLRMGAFVTVFAAFVVFFSPLESVLLALGSSAVLAKL
jgi:hypothetical protein